MTAQLEHIAFLRFFNIRLDDTLVGDVSLNSSHRVGPLTPLNELSSKFFKPEFYLVNGINIVAFRPHDRVEVQLFQICIAGIRTF